MGSEPSNVAAQLRERLLKCAAPIVKAHGGELVDVEVQSGGRDQHTARVLVHSDAGVTIRFCEGISRELSDLLDVEDPLPGKYRLEVTSPGLDRQLTTDGDFRRAQGRKLKAVLRDGRTEIGRLSGWNEEEIKMEISEGEVRAISRQSIAKATVEVEF